jgi:hypothetical protein
MTSPDPPLTQANLLDELKRALPEEAEQIDDTGEFFTDEEGVILAAVVAEHVSHPLLALVNEPARTMDQGLLLVRLVAFLDRMYASEDVAVMDLADTGTFELLGDSDASEVLLPMLAPAAAKQLRAYLGLGGG